MPKSDYSIWLTLPKASAQLGISPQTLRQWADDGRVPSFRTPGGHRRFRASDLAQIQTKSASPAPTQSLQLLAHAALGRTRLALSDGRLANEAWYRNYPQAALETQRELGRRLVMTLSEILAMEDESQLLVQARELGRAYSRINTEYAITMPDALRAFFFFRETFYESLIEVAKTAPTLDMLGLSRRMSRFVDEMLLTMVEAQEPTKRRKKK